MLYYVLVAVCIFARKAEWLKSAALGAALLFPAVAALHGIVLAAVHVPAAVDLDVYGAFQLCAVGALAAPVTVRVSRTYFHQPGRNTIFVWASIVLAGLLSLTVEFYRINTVPCTSFPGANVTFSTDPADFPYGNTSCGMVCNTSYPKSPIRGGSANNIDVVPAPTVFTFNAATLVSAACAIPCILMMIGIIIKIVESDAGNRSDQSTQDQRLEREYLGDERQDGESGWTAGQPKGNNKMIDLFQRWFEIPFFLLAILAIVIIGERNLFSGPVRYDNEPMANVGQWSPIAGVALGIMGSLYLLIAEAVEDELHPEKRMDNKASPPPSRTHMAITQNFAQVLIKSSKTLGLFSPKSSTDLEFQNGMATNAYPEVPGERNRNPDLGRITTQYSQQHVPGSIDPSTRGRSRSRTSSFNSTLSDVHARRAKSPEAIPRPPKRRDTLDVPSPSSPSFPRRTLSGGSSERPDVSELRRQRTPSIKITLDSDLQ